MPEPEKPEPYTTADFFEEKPPNLSGELVPDAIELEGGPKDLTPQETADLFKELNITLKPPEGDWFNGSFPKKVYDQEGQHLFTLDVLASEPGFQMRYQLRIEPAGQAYLKRAMSVSPSTPFKSPFD